MKKTLVDNKIKHFWQLAVVAHKSQVASRKPPFTIREQANEIPR